VTKLRPSASAAPPGLKLRRSPVDQKSLVVAHLVERRPACVVQRREPRPVFPSMERSLAWSAFPRQPGDAGRAASRTPSRLPIAAPARDDVTPLESGCLVAV